MKLNLNTDTLDWTNPNIFDFRYIYHLAMMVYERYTKIGISPTGLANRDWLETCETVFHPVFDITKFSPNGLLTWEHLSTIYYSMIYLGTYVYLNENNLSEDKWVRGDNRRWLNYSLENMCEIADFDFFANPFIPGESLAYYNKFLTPIKKVLSSFRKIWTNSFFVDRNANKGYYISNESLTLPKIEVDGEQKTINGRDLLTFYQTPQNFINEIDRKITNGDYSSLGNVEYLGYQYGVNTKYIKWYGYDGEGDLEIVSDWVYDYIAMRKEKEFKCSAAYSPGIPYQVYLYHTTYFDESWTNNAFLPSHFKSPWNMLITCQTGIVPINGEVTETISLPEDITFELEHLTPEKFWRIKYESSPDYPYYTTLYQEDLLEVEVTSVFYRPLIVFDYSSKFIYL